MDLSVALSEWLTSGFCDKTSEASFRSQFTGSLFGSKTNHHVSIDRNFIKFSRDSEKEQSLPQRENEKKGANTCGIGRLEGWPKKHCGQRS